MTIVKMKPKIKKAPLEGDFQSKFKEELRKLFPGCIIKRNSTDDIQGFPDLTVYHNGKFAMLEMKRSRTAVRRPNQDYYIEFFTNFGAYAAFVYPENMGEVIGDLWSYFYDE